MNRIIRPQDLDVVILCGGRGRRLSAVINDRPKPMALVRGGPFLDILLNYVASFGFHRFILCVGHMSGFIIKYYSNKTKPYSIIFSKEKKPLGTAGALKNAKVHIKSNPFLVLNGDSFCNLHLGKFVDFHFKKRASYSMVLSKAQNEGEYGRVNLDKSGKIIRFNEKSKSTSLNTFVNAGIYLLDKTILDEIPEDKKFYLEYGIFPKIVNRRIYGFVSNDKFVDIGTQKDLKRFKKIYKDRIDHEK